MEVPKRLTPKLNTIRLLLAKSGNQCAFENCTEVIFNDANELVGECCHIEGALPESERFNPNQTNEERRSFDNLIFLCHKHHIVTDNVKEYTVSRLKEIKYRHHEKFSEREITINPNQIDHVIDRFNEIATHVSETLDIVKRIESKQNVILEDTIEKPKKNILEYFGQPASPNFIGRKKELQDIKTSFEKFNTLFIQGISGIGKTILVAHFLDSIKNYKVFWVKCDITDSKELFLVSFSRFLNQNFNDNSLEICLSEKDERIIENRLIHILKEYSICLVFDALNGSNHNLYSYTQIFGENLTNSKVVVTTTQDFNILNWSNPAFKTSIKGVSFQTFQTLLEFYKVENLSSSESSLLFMLTGGHPYLLKLAASISIYQPISSFISSFENRTISEIEDYIKTKLIAELEEDERKLLVYIIALEIPFRYQLGSYISEISYENALKSLQQKFLVEKLYDDFYVVPEFINQHLKEQDKDLIEPKHLEILIDYLRGLEGSVKIIEKSALINLLLKSGFEKTAKKECTDFLSSLMGAGHFNVTVKYSNNLLENKVSKKWSFVLYILGRVYRIQGDYIKSLEAYDKGIELDSDLRLYHNFLFEKASVLFYLSAQDENEGLRKEVFNIYKQLSESKDLPISIQSELALSRILVYDGNHKEAIERVEKVIKHQNFETVNVYIKAQAWQALGDAYRKNKKYKKAFESFDNSIELYKKSLDSYGLNAFEGLYHLYISYGTAYSNCKDYESAAQMFAINVGLSEQFGLESKLRDSLLDLGYHLILSKQFEEAIDVLNEHYDLISKEESLQISDLPFVFGCLLFANWYSGRFVEAVEFLGLYCKASILNGKRPLITVLEGNDKADEFDLINYFKRGMKTLIIPEDKSINDFQNWISEVSANRPELKEALGEFYMFQKK
ncbi:MAG: hypothetical protein AB3N18_05660 [Allomuricauda sp.]